MSHTPLSRPPIVEALLDFRVYPGAKPDEVALRLNQVVESLKSHFPEESGSDTDDEERVILRKYLHRGPVEWLSRKRLRSEDGRQTILISADRLTFSLAFPEGGKLYSTWDSIEEPAFEAWSEYERTVAPAALMAIATRFVNRIIVPRGHVDGVFTHPPTLPIKNVALSSYNDRIAGHTLDGYGTRIGRRFDARPAGGPCPVYFDVEASRTFDGEPLVSPIQRRDLASILARMRELKNNLFYESLTSYTLDLYRDDAS